MTHLVYGADEKYLPCLLASLYTALKSTSSPLDVTVFKSVERGGRSEEFSEVILKLASYFSNVNINIRRFEIDDLSEYSRTESAVRLPPISMLPLFVPWLIDDKCIFLDADTLILKDITELFMTDINGYLIGAAQAWHVCKYLDPHTANCSRYIPTRRRIAKNVRRNLILRGGKMGFSLEELRTKYFNSGVIVFDPRRIRQTDPSASLINVEKSKKHWSGLPDMDRLNEYFKDSVYLLDLKWNVIKDVSRSRRYLPSDLAKQVIRATKYPSILHFGGFYDSQTWNRPWYKKRKRFKIYEKTCKEIEVHTGINLFQMFNDRAEF